MALLDSLKRGDPVVLVVQLHELRQPYYGHFYGVDSSGEVELRYGEHDSISAHFPVKDILQVSPTTEEGLGKWGKN